MRAFACAHCSHCYELTRFQATAIRAGFVWILCPHSTLLSEIWFFRPNIHLILSSVLLAVAVGLMMTGLKFLIGCPRVLRLRKQACPRTFLIS